VKKPPHRPTLPVAVVKQYIFNCIMLHHVGCGGCYKTTEMTSNLQKKD
jgi:hypothetical protein